MRGMACERRCAKNQRSQMTDVEVHVFVSVRGNFVRILAAAQR